MRFKLRSNAKPALGRKQQIRCNEITSQLARLIRSPATRRNLLNLTVNRFFLPPPPPSPEKTLERNSATGRLPTNERKKDKAKTFARFFSSRLKLVQNRTTSPYNINAWICLLLSFIRKKKNFLESSIVCLSPSLPLLSLIERVDPLPNLARGTDSSLLPPARTRGTKARVKTWPKTLTP